MLDLAVQRFDEMLRAGTIERDHVHDDVGSKLCDLCAELPILFFGLAVEDDILDSVPRKMRTVDRRRATAHIHDLMPELDQRGYEVTSDVTATSDDDDA